MTAVAVIPLHGLEAVVQPLLLICDPEHDYSRRFHEALSLEGMDVRHVRSANECLEEVQAYFPRAVLVSTGLPAEELEFLLAALDDSPEVAPELVLTGPSSPVELSQRWGIPVASCLQTPVNEDQLAGRLLRGDLDRPSDIQDKAEA